jgi:predicted PurR-regulated permease PerM
MSATRQAMIWLGVVFFFSASLFLLSDILLPFIVGALSAYLLDPLADRLEARGMSRTAAASVISGLFFLLIILAILLILPLLQNQVVRFADNFPGYVERLHETARPLFEQLRAVLSEEDIKSLQSGAAKYTGDAMIWVGRIIKGVLSGGMAVVNLLSLLFVTPLVTWYMLRDWDVMVARIDSWMPRAHVGVIREQARLIDETIAGFIRGQLTVCFIQGCFFGIGLTLVGLDFGFLVGLVAGLLSFVPYVGIAVGLVIGFAIALAQFSSVGPILGVAGVFAVGQVIEGNFLTPKMVGDRVKLHAVWIVFALFAFGNLFGFVGVLIAVPTAAVIGVLVRFFIARYLESDLYSGGRTPPVPDPQDGTE